MYARSEQPHLSVSVICKAKYNPGQSYTFDDFQGVPWSGHSSTVITPVIADLSMASANEFAISLSAAEIEQPGDSSFVLDRFSDLL